MDLQQHGIQEDTTSRLDSICCCNIGDKGDDNNITNTISSSINMDNVRQKVLALLVVL